MQELTLRGGEIVNCEGGRDAVANIRSRVAEGLQKEVGEVLARITQKNSKS